MGIIQNALRKWKDKREMEKEYGQEQRMMEDFEAKKLSSDERELRRFQEEDRKEFVKGSLENRRKEMNNKIWSGKLGNPLNAPNVVAGQKELFKNNENLFLGRATLFDEPSLFFRR